MDKRQIITAIVIFIGLSIAVMIGKYIALATAAPQKSNDKQLQYRHTNP